MELIKMLILFAIPNCDTVKKARNFLKTHQIDYEFIDFKKNPPSRELLETWSVFYGSLPVNFQGKTFRLHKDYYETLNHSDKIACIIANPSMLKRPILMLKDQVLAIGFDEHLYEKQLKD